MNVQISGPIRARREMVSICFVFLHISVKGSERFSRRRKQLPVHGSSVVCNVPGEEQCLGGWVIRFVNELDSV